MLSYYKYKVDHGMMTLDQVPEPYQTQLREEGYTDSTSTSTTTTA